MVLIEVTNTNKVKLLLSKPWDGVGSWGTAQFVLNVCTK